MTEITPAWIASRLTEPQRQALLWLPADGSAREVSQDNGGLRSELQDLEAMELQPHIAAELVMGCGGHVREARWYMFYRATTLGLRVRAVVAQDRSE